MSERERTRAGKVQIEQGSDPRDTARALHHCLKYMSQDALDLGLSQTASLLEMVAHLALDEAKAMVTRH
jgi:hypothetical protein